LEEARINLGNKISGRGSPCCRSRFIYWKRDKRLFTSGICLPEKDLPILLAAIEDRATLTECTSDI
jgi:hypothetical protein